MKSSVLSVVSAFVYWRRELGVFGASNSGHGGTAKWEGLSPQGPHRGQGVSK